LTSIGTVALAYARLAHGQGEVAPVRPAQRSADQKTAYQPSAAFAASHFAESHLAERGHGEREQPGAQGLRGARANVVDLPIANKVATEPAIGTRQPRPSVPFLAQQIAQEGLPDRSEAMRQKHAAVTEAYVLASDDAAKILGPVRPRELLV
jgi:hypothetical protein